MLVNRRLGQTKADKTLRHTPEPSLTNPVRISRLVIYYKDEQQTLSAGEDKGDVALVTTHMILY